MATEKMTYEDIREAAEVARGGNGAEMVTVKALGPVRDNGNSYQAGNILHMEMSLVPAHVAAGQVELVAPAKTAKAQPAKGK